MSKTRVLSILSLCLLVAAAIGAFGWWQHYKSTPTYSLAVLIDAVHRDDAQAFDRVFDTDRVVQSFLADLALRSESGLLGNLPLPFRDKLKSAPPSVVNYLKTGMREAVRRRVNELDESMRNAPFMVTAVALYFKTSSRLDGDNATVSISRNDQKLELGMVRNGDGWRVVSAKDDALATRMIANMAKDLPGEFSPLDLVKPFKDGLPKLPLP